MSFCLVVDDNRTTADSLSRILKALGMQVRTAYGSTPGLSILNSEVPRAVFLDINMPGVSGLELLGYIKRDPRLSSVPVFIVTSDDQVQTRERALKGGAVDVIIKPATVDVLERLLRSANLF